MSLTTSSHGSKNNNYRAVTIRNFRNLGINHETSIVINRSIEKEQLGNVVILVGQNNSGKTNVLDAIEVASTGKRDSRDIPDKSLTGTDLIPAVTFDICDGMTNYLDYRDHESAVRTGIGYQDFETINTKAVRNDARFREIITKILCYISETGDGSSADLCRSYLDSEELTSSAVILTLHRTDRSILESFLSRDDVDYYYDTFNKVVNFVPMEPLVNVWNQRKLR